MLEPTPIQMPGKTLLRVYHGPKPGNSRIEEQLRRFSAYATHLITKRYGSRIGIWVGCGYPKSGTVWLCQLMASVLDLPYAQNYLLPIAMSSVVHAHWDYDPRLPNSLYIVRDGRDVMVSYYYYRMKTTDGHKNPGAAKKLRKIFENHMGKGFDPKDIKRYLPKFIELELDGKLGHVTSWAVHVRRWTQPRPKNVGILRYEDLLTDPCRTLGDAFEQVLGDRFEPSVLETAVSRFEFGRRSGRPPGVEDQSAFMRKGVSGEWKESFTKEAAEVFDHFAGDVLTEQGYEPNRNWLQGF